MSRVHQQPRGRSATGVGAVTCGRDQQEAGDHDEDSEDKAHDPVRLGGTGHGDMFDALTCLPPTGAEAPTWAG